ncbi:MAG: DUF1294 domain-containing protein [Clostridia bacterium]|nr:DUF1294 domain-containing protein [Clostridia bacterium]
MKDAAIWIYLAFAAVMSIITMILYMIDKSKAQRGKWRIKEATLLGFGLFGGAIGGFLGMYLFRHKTKHWYFTAVNLLGLIINVAVVVLLLKLKNS